MRSRRHQRYRFDQDARASFEMWFLPLYAWHAKTGIHEDQLANLLKHFHRAGLTGGTSTTVPAMQRIHEAIQAGATDWLTRKSELATVVRARRG